MKYANWAWLWLHLSGVVATSVATMIPVRNLSEAFLEKNAQAPSGLFAEAGAFSLNSAHKVKM